MFTVKVVQRYACNMDGKLEMIEKTTLQSADSVDFDEFPSEYMVTLDENRVIYNVPKLVTNGEWARDDGYTHAIYVENAMGKTTQFARAQIPMEVQVTKDDDVK